MISKLRDIVAEYINKASDIENWQDIRVRYFDYSYLAFWSICAYELNPLCRDINDIINTSNKYKLAENEILPLVTYVPEAGEFVTSVIEMVSENRPYDINNLYQTYLSKDYTIFDGKVVFEGGKNNRDVLGAYYTQEEFAYEITRKALNDYIVRNNIEENACLKIADYSCGGGAFLVSACKLCHDKNLRVKIYGYDVDPIAIMITRFRLVNETKLELENFKIILGNPVVRICSEDCISDKFKLAREGRFYNLKMGIMPETNISIAVGNPPWEKIRFEEKKFFHHYVISEHISTKSEREVYLNKMSGHNRSFYEAIRLDYEEAKTHVKKDGYFERSSSGELNTYALFTELCRKSLCKGGITGLIIKSSLLKMPVYSDFFKDMTEKRDIYEIYMFSNRRKIFNIDSREEFSVIYLHMGNTINLQLSLNIDSFEGFGENEKIELSYELLNKLNPDTGMLPNIMNNRDLLFLTDIYDKHHTFGNVYPQCKFGRLVHLTNHSQYIKKENEDGYEAVYEGKFIEIYTGKYATFSEMNEMDIYKNKATARNILDIDSQEYPKSRFYIKKELWNDLSKNFDGDYIIAWRSLTSATNRRTMLATLLPLIPTCQSIQILQLPKRNMLQVLAVFNSVVFDYIVRLKMAGLDLTQTIVKQIPIPSTSRFLDEIHFMGVNASIEKHINSRIRLLYLSDTRLDDFFGDIDIYNIEEIKSRKEIVSEIDKLVAYVYGIDKDNMRNIVLSFDKYYTKEEVKIWF